VRKISVIGIGAGHPDQLTVQAIAAIERLDVLLVHDKGREKEDLVGLRKLLCERYLGARPYRVLTLADPKRDPAIADYSARVADWHERRLALYESALREQVAEHECVGILVWGDPSLYDSTLRLLQNLQNRASVPFDYEVIPGVTSISALCARHRIALNRIAGSVLITTGRKLCEHGLPADATDIVVMLDADCAFTRVDPHNLEIYWGAYIGTTHELLRAGPLPEVRDELANVRSSARREHGWIMDIYVLRRRSERALDSAEPDL
jgi:precorrin-6A synthase